MLLTDRRVIATAATAPERSACRGRSKGRQGEGRAGLGQAKPACTAGAGDVVHASVNVVGRALPLLCLASAVLRATTDAVAKLVRCPGKVWRRAEELNFNHSPPPPRHYTTRHASLPLALARHPVRFAPAVAARKASERTKVLAGEANALLDCSPGGVSGPLPVTATASIASERTNKGAMPGFARWGTSSGTKLV